MGCDPPLSSMPFSLPFLSICGTASALRWPTRRFQSSRHPLDPFNRLTPLSKWQYRARLHLRPRRDHEYRASRARARRPTNSRSTLTGVLPHIGSHAAASQHRHAPGARALSMSTPPLRKTIRNGDARPANFCSDAPPFFGLAGTGMPDEPASLDTLGETLYPLFCVSVY